MSTRSDPVGDKHYLPLQQAETSSTILFYLSAGLTLALVGMDGSEWPEAYQTVQVVLIVLVVANAILGFGIRLYFAPRASEKRQQDLLSYAFSTPMIHDRSTGYYNNEQKAPLLRMAAAVMESAMFTAAILQCMLIPVRIQTFVYVCIFVALISFRQTDLGLIGIAAQVLFGEQVLSRWVRMEWLRMKSEQIFEQLRPIFMGKPNPAAPHTQGLILVNYSQYESAKAIASVSLSSRCFGKLNPQLTKDWDRIRADMSI